MGSKSPLVLVITNSKDATSTFLLEKARPARTVIARLNTDNMQQYCINFNSHTCSWSIQLEDVLLTPDNLRAIYYRRPKPPTLPDIQDAATLAWAQNEFRSAFGGILMGLPEYRWMDHPLLVSRASYKLDQLASARRLGLNTPNTLVTMDPDRARNFCDNAMWNVVTKPLGHGEVKSSADELSNVVYTNSLQREHADQFSLVANCPVLLQELINKEYDIRVIVIGNDCYAVAIHSQEHEYSQIDCRRNNMAGMKYSIITLPNNVNSALVELVERYSLHFGAIDLIKDIRGDYWFLELNPAGQWAWLEQATGIELTRSIVSQLEHIAHL